MMFRINKQQILFAFILGLSAAVSQVVLLREAIAVFYGNETAYAIILGCWLFWVGLGSFAASRFAWPGRHPETSLLFLLYGVSAGVPLTVCSMRVLRSVLNIPLGEIVGIPMIFLIDFFEVAPLAFVFGSIYSLVCRWAESDGLKRKHVVSVSRIYLTEALGSAVGGLIFSFFLVQRFPALHIAFVVSFINLSVMSVMMLRAPRRRFVHLSLFLAFAVFILTGGMQKTDHWSRSVQWQGFRILGISDSKYGNLTMVEGGHDRILYENGVLSFSTREEYSSEEIIHFPMLAHPRPQDVLLIGSALDGSLREILKYPVDHVDYIDLDPQVIRLAAQTLPEDVLEPLRDPRLQIRFADARLLLKNSGQTYDLIILNLADPLNAMINRYYTLEFFQEVRGNLKQGGIISLAVSSSENYLNEEARAFLRSIHSTLKAVFADVKSIPGDTSIFLACQQKGVLSYDANLYLSRLRERGIRTEYVREYYLPYKMSADRIAYIEDVLQKEGDINTDAHPIAYLYDTLLWSSHFNSLFKTLFSRMQRLQLLLWLIPGGLFLLGVCRFKSSAAFPVKLSMLTTGFSEIAFQIIVILSFQALYGYAYYQIGLILAFFMIGLIAGSLRAVQWLSAPVEEQWRTYQKIQAAISVYPVFLPVVFFVYQRAVFPPGNGGMIAMTYTALPVMAGYFGGAQYPLAVSLLDYNSGGKKSVASSAGETYAIDVLGATAGAVLTGTLLIPLWGMVQVACFLALMNGAVWLLLKRGESAV